MAYSRALVCLGIVLGICTARCPVAAETSPALAPGQWTAQRARNWYSAQPWLVGCNFLPSTAVNDVEMWQADTFDAATIDRELGWARELGFNTVRVFVNYVVWETDAEGLKRRFDQFLDMAAKHRISVMPVLLDDCNFAGREAKAGPQPDPVPGVHNSQWVSSPPLRMVTERRAWPGLQKYVQDMVAAFGRDPRVVVWDLYNEPGNSGMGERSLPLVEAVFGWAREARPTQPATVGVWTDFDGEMSKRMFALSDVVSFHGYDDPRGVRHKITLCESFGRPVLCTEWLRRQTGNTFENLLRVFDEHRVGCYHWGLVAGRTQTYYPWGSPPNAPEPTQWQHDVLRRDGTPFSRAEVGIIKAFFGRTPASVTEVVPTARKEAVSAKERWSAERAWRWYDAQPWPCGFNYVPANSISYTEMWMNYSFDPELIDRELKLADEIGFNCVRVVLPFVVWEAEPTAFKKRLETFLDICGRHGIRVMFTLFDDCVFGPIRDPVFGKQPAVVEGWYANGWTPSPGHGLVRDATTWPRLEKYVKDVVTTFKDNPHVWVWDLYNEPTNGGLGDVSLPLAEKVFRWAREVGPSQPLTVGQWNGNARLNEIIYRHSDVITFHDYGGPDPLAAHIADLQRQGRPLICTEWLNRGRGSTVADCLPIFRRRTVGCMHWGLVNGKTQTHLNWGHRPGQPDPPVWQHDLFRSDHTPYEPSEIELFRSIIGPGTLGSTGAPSAAGPPRWMQYGLKGRPRRPPSTRAG